MHDLIFAAIQAVKAYDANEPLDIFMEDMRSALAEYSQDEEIYWYVGTDGKYYNSHEAKLFMDEKTKGLHLNPPQWRLDKGDLIPLVAYRPKSQRRSTASLTSESLQLASPSQT